MLLQQSFRLLNIKNTVSIFDTILHNFNTNMSSGRSRGGRGGGRGGRGRQNHNDGSRHYHEKVSEQHRGDDEGGTSFQGTSRGRPGHLRGKDIGMFYARQGKIKKIENEKKDRLNIKLDSVKEQHLSHMLNIIKRSEFINNEEDIRDNNLFLEAYNSHLENVSIPNSIDSKLKRNTDLDGKFKKELESMKISKKYRNMLEFREKLPAFSMKNEIIDLIANNQVVVLSGETGCGKTTQVAQFILDSYIESGKGSICRIICTQPRRISAISVAERVAEERGERCGESNSVGWQIRLEKKVPRKEGSILYCTTGIMLQWLKSDRSLGDISHIILDEIHERDVDTDFLMIILKDLIASRSDLKLVLMSATLNAVMFSNYFRQCPMINIPGQTFPVTKNLLEDVIELTGYRPDLRNRRDVPKWKKHLPNRKNYNDTQDIDLETYYKSLTDKYSSQTISVLRDWNEDAIDLNLVVVLLRHICLKEKDGAILIFLPGWEQISKLNNQLCADTMFCNSSRFILIPLHSMMPTVSQKEVFIKPPIGVRKIILATNIAETSITIDDVVFVIDCGQIKMSNFDVKNNIETLKPEWESLANAKQRKGRAGRVQPGISYHLYTKAREAKLETYSLPEMLRTKLESLCLKIKIMKLGKISTFLEKALNPPQAQSIDLSLKLLQKLNALDENESLTPLGFHLARLPLDPLTGRMILFGSIFSCLDPILTVAASLSFKDAFLVPLGKERLVDERKREISANTRSDHLMLAKAFKDWQSACKNGEDRAYCWHNYLSSNTLKMLGNLKVQFAKYLQDLHFLHCDNPKHPDFNINSKNEMLLKAIICAGLYPNVAKLQMKKLAPNSRKSPVLHTQEDGRVSLHPKSVNNQELFFPSQWLVYYQKIKSTGIYLHDTTMVHPYALLFFGGKLTTGVENDKPIIAVDDWIIFNCPSQTAYIVMELRKELEKLLEYKISHPNKEHWNHSQDSKESLIMQSIVELITSDVSMSSYGVWNADSESD